MDFKIGDLVRFVDEAIEGHITSVQGDMVGVTDGTGFEIPVPKAKITLIHGNMRRGDDEPEAGDSLPEPDLPFVERGIYVAVEGEQSGGSAKFYLVNHSSYDLLASVAKVSDTEWTGLFAGKIAKRSTGAFYSANFNQVGRWPGFRIQILRHSERPQVSPIAPIDRDFRVKPAALTLSKEHDGLLDAKAWRFQIDKPEENIGLDRLKAQFISHRPKKKNL